MILLDHPPQLSAPYRFVGPYAHCYDLPEVAADPRHVYIIHDILCSWEFESALEIGSFDGATATALVEAVNQKIGDGQRLMQATFCDVSIRLSLLNVVSRCRDQYRVRITRQPSWQVLDTNEFFDFIYLDAAHDLESVGLEMTRLLRRRPLCLMAHDTSAAAAGYSKCEGAAHLAETFGNLPGYHCIQDNDGRPGERTERGLFLATRDDRLFAHAQRIFARWGKAVID